MPDLERIQQRTAGTLSQQWYEDGAAVDPGTVTLGITRADGTVLVAAGAVTSGATTAPRTFNLTTTHTATLDRLTVTWTSTLKGTLVSYVEVVGGFLFSLAEARALSVLANAATYPTADIADKRTEVEQDIEQEAGVAFVPRYELETLDGSGGATIMLKRPLVRTIRSASIGGTALSVGELAELAFSTTGAVYRAAGWTCGIGNVVIGYEHGFQDAPRPIKTGALDLAKMRLLGKNSPVDERATTFAAAEGGTYGLVVAGRGGSHFGLPDLDSAVDRYSLKVGIA